MNIFKRFWGWIDGWKTRVILILVALLQIVVILDPQMIATTFNFNTQETAGITLLFVILGILAREIASKPGLFAKKDN